MSTATLITAEQFAQMHFGETEDYELVNGELNPLPGATPMHNAVRDNLCESLRGCLRRAPIGRALGETDCQLSADTIRRPDISVFLGEKSKQFDPTRTPVPFAPDIAVEILSPSETAMDVSGKALEYLAAGSHEVWLVDHRNAEVSIRARDGLRLLTSSDRLESPLLPGFSQSVTGILAW